MSYEVPDFKQPIFESELKPTLRTKFRVLCKEVYEWDAIHHESPKDDAAALHRKIRKEVKAHPIFARTLFQDDMTGHLLLLELLIDNVGSVSYETIQFLIKMNPHSLLWKGEDDDDDDDEDEVEDDDNSDDDVFLIIHELVDTEWGCKMLPWIAQHYPWVFQHKACQEAPPHFEMLSEYVNGYCDLETAQNFYKVYPQGLREKLRGAHPLTAILRGRRVPDADFFIWMAREYPEAVCSGTHSVLHDLCASLSSRNEYKEECTPNMTKILHFLISEHPNLLLKEGYGGSTPIQWLARSCNRPPVQEMIILILKVCPQCVQAKPYCWLPQLLNVPFIEQVYPLVMNELEIDRDMSILDHVSKNLEKAAVLSTYHCNPTNTNDNSHVTSSFLGSLSEVYRSWAELRRDSLSKQKQLIQENITQVCLSLEGDDVSDESEEDFDEDSSDDGSVFMLFYGDDFTDEDSDDDDSEESDDDDYDSDDDDSGRSDDDFDSEDESSDEDTDDGCVFVIRYGVDYDESEEDDDDSVGGSSFDDD